MLIIVNVRYNGKHQPLSLQSHV